MKERLKILLVEDDEDISRIIQASLAMFGQHTVVVASNGPEALELAGQCEADCILLDAMMPEMDGYEVCQRLKADAKTSSIPVIFMTAQQVEKEIQRALALGAVGYLTKPFDPLTLGDQIQAILAAEPPTSSASNM